MWKIILFDHRLGAELGRVSFLAIGATVLHLTQSKDHVVNMSYLFLVTNIIKPSENHNFHNDLSGL